MLMMCYFAEPPVGLYHYKCQLEGCYILIYIIKMEVWKGLVSCGTVVYIIKKPSMHQIKRYNIWQAYMTCTSWDWRRSPLPGRTTRCFNTPTPMNMPSHRPHVLCHRHDGLAFDANQWTEEVRREKFKGHALFYTEKVVASAPTIDVRHRTGRGHGGWKSETLVWRRTRWLYIIL
jgi:hypothetical protein